MTPQIVNLIEATRALGLKLTDQPAPQCIRIGGHPSSFPERLATLQRALEDVDASGANALSGGPDAPVPDTVKRLEKALDGLLRFIQIKGVDVDAAVDIVAQAMDLDIEGKDKTKPFETLPMFRPKNWKKKKAFKPRFQLMPDLPGDAGIEDLRKIAGMAQETANLMGSAAGRQSTRLIREVEELKAEAGAVGPGAAPRSGGHRNLVMTPPTSRMTSKWSSAS
jgi:hypothetical protein